MDHENDRHEGKSHNDNQYTIDDQAYVLQFLGNSARNEKRKLRT